MALTKSVALGAVAAVAVPFAVGDRAGELSEYVRLGLVRFEVAGVPLGWSWPLFCFVTLFAWGAFAWSNK